MDLLVSPFRNDTLLYWILVKKNLFKIRRICCQFWKPKRPRRSPLRHGIHGNYLPKINYPDFHLMRKPRTQHFGPIFSDFLAEFTHHLGEQLKVQEEKEVNKCFYQ